MISYLAKEAHNIVSVGYMENCATKMVNIFVLTISTDFTDDLFMKIVTRI